MSTQVGQPCVACPRGTVGLVCTTCGQKYATPAMSARVAALEADIRRFVVAGTLEEMVGQLIADRTALIAERNTLEEENARLRKSVEEQAPIIGKALRAAFGEPRP